MNKTILFIGGGVESVPGIRTAKSLGLKVIVSDYSPSAPGFQLSDYSIVSSTYDIEGTWKALEVYLNTEGRIHGVISVATDVPLTVASIAKRLGTPGISIDAAKLSMDKIAMKVRFREAGIPIPWFSEVFSVDDVRSALDNIAELIIKPVDSRGARGVQRITEKADIVAAFNNAKENSPSGRVMIEEFLSGHQISTESIIYDDLESTPGFSDRNYEYMDRFAPFIIENGGTMPSKLSEADRISISDLTIKAGRALGVNRWTVKGDMILTSEGPKVIELATRLSGGWFSTNQITLATGIDMVKIAIFIALGEEIEIPPRYPVCINGSAIRFFFPSMGKLISIKDPFGLLNKEWVKKFDIYAQIGDEIESPTNHTKRTGYVVTIGKDRHEAVERAEMVISKVKINTI